MNKYFSLFVFFFLIFACKEKPKTSKYGCVHSIWVESPVQATTIGFKSNKIIYKLMNIDSTKDTISIAGYLNTLIYYKLDTNKIFVDYVFLSRESGGKHSQHYFSTGSVLNLSQSNQVKQFFIDWPNGEIDSLYVDYQKDLKRDNPCCCQYPLQSIKLNSKNFIEKKEFDNYGIYIFER